MGFLWQCEKTVIVLQLCYVLRKILRQSLPRVKGFFQKEIERESHIYSKDYKLEFCFSSVGINAAKAAANIALDNRFQNQDIPYTGAHITTCDDVRRVISSLPLNKSPGHDKIKARVFKDCLPVILEPLTEIINC